MLNAKQKILLANGCLLLSAITLLVCFSTLIARLLNFLIVENVISGFENNILSTTTLLVFLLCVVFWLWQSGTKKFNIIFSSFAVILHITQRNSSFWTFYPFLWIPQLYILDVVVLIFTIPLFLNLIESKKKVADSIDANKGFIEECVVNDESNDSFHRAEVAAHVAEAILATKNKTAFAIGIVGSYGSGKTSFINLIQKKLPNADIEIMQFKPWSSDKAENISADFFDQLAHQLYYLNPNLGSLIATYSRKLSRVNLQRQQLIQQLYSFNKPNIHSDRTYHQINLLLEKSPKKIVIAIDDIDRLYNEEIMEVIRLIRNTANFANVFYLVAYEPKFVQSALKSLNPEVADNFLDKIIQLVLPLPKREQNDLLQLLETSLQSIISEEHFISLKEDIAKYGFMEGYELSFHQAFRNSRDVIRFINSFQLSYRALKNETLFEHLFILEIIKFRFIDIYDQLYERKSEWLVLSARTSRHEEYYELREIKRDGNTHLVIEDSLNIYTKDDAKLVTSLLKNLFNDFNRHTRAKQSIIYPMFFERYFRLRISRTEISEFAFQSNWKLGLQKMKEYIQQLSQQGLDKEITTRLLQVEPTSRNDFELQICSLFYAGPNYVAAHGWTSFDNYALINILWDLEGRVSDKFYGGNRESYKEFLKNVLKDCHPPFLFEVGFLYDAKNSPGRDIVLTRNEMTKQQVAYFDAHVSNLGLTDEAMWILYSIRQTDNSDLWHFETEVLSLTKAIITTQDPINFLRYSISFDTRDKRKVRLDLHILEFFEDVKQFRNFVSEHKLLKDDVREDYLRFLDKCTTFGIRTLVDYIFIPALARISQAEENSQ